MLDDSIIHAIIVKQDEPSNDQSSIYYIFERLNSGGERLAEQEIRVALYHGKLVDLLKELNNNQAWRSLYGKPNPRMRDQEMILRFLAFRFHVKPYARPMKEFLNEYIGANRHLEQQSREEVSRAFTTAVEAIRKCLGQKAFKPTVFNAAVFDSLMVGVSRRLAKKQIKDCAAFKRRYEALMRNEAYMASIQRATADEENVRQRLTLATEAFADL